MTQTPHEPAPAVLRIQDRDPIRPFHTVMIVLVGFTLAGGLLLLSAAETTGTPDGAIPWREDSLLRAVVQVLCLDYQFPTFYVGDVKNYVLGIGTGLALIVLGVAFAGQASEDETRRLVVSSADGEPVAKKAEKPGAPRRQISPLAAAQLMLGLYVAWSFTSAAWSHAPDLATGGSILLAIHVAWAFAVAVGLGAGGARVAARVLVAVSLVTAAIAVWYHYGRNPTIRADFPVGNPTHLAACLIPAVLLCAARVRGRAESHRATSSARTASILGASVGVAACAWAFVIAGSRGAYVGLLLGVLATVFFLLRGRWRIAPVMVACVIAVVGTLHFLRGADSFSPDGRSATVRLRFHAWSYAWELFTDRPLLGNGQSAFACLGDSLAVRDVLSDPLVFESRISHAHNEWIEVLADLGAIGLVLITTALVLTLRAGAAAMRRTESEAPADRARLAALMGALVGLVVNESFGVGLRVPGVGIVFFTIIGLIWALSRTGLRPSLHHGRSTKSVRWIVGFLGPVCGLGVIALAHQDFAAARDLHDAKAAFAAERLDEAIRLTSRSHARLNPQRALTGWYRHAQAQLRVADFLQARAQDREDRARAEEMNNPRLIELANADRQLADRHCDEGMEALRDLVRRSPGFFDHGRLAFGLNLIRARNAGARHDARRQQSLLAHAAAALQLEMRRQPFHPVIAAEFVRIAGPTLDPAELITTLARPLRHHRITGTYVELLAELSGRASFVEALAALARSAYQVVATRPAPDDLDDFWAPELLRLAAAEAFIRREYGRALTLLERAAPACDGLAQSAPFGAAACYAELADSHSYAAPTRIAPAIAYARWAIALAPKSGPGRRLIRGIKTRMVQYHLLDDDEKEALHRLRETASGQVSEQALLMELGLRYRSLCESLLLAPADGDVFLRPRAELANRITDWIRRAVELNDHDTTAHYIAANLAFQSADDDQTAQHLRRALDLGLAPTTVRRFLDRAVEVRPVDDALLQLRAALPAPNQNPSRSPRTDSP